MLNKKTSQLMKNNLLSIISDIADKNYQKKAWICGESPGTDFDETVCQFADMGDPILENYQDFEITDRQYKILKNFRDKFGDFWEKNSWPAFFIDTPEWEEIMNLAKEVLKAFDYKVPIQE